MGIKEENRRKARNQLKRLLNENITVNNLNISFSYKEATALEITGEGLTKEEIGMIKGVIRRINYKRSRSRRPRLHYKYKLLENN